MSLAQNTPYTRRNRYLLQLHPGCHRIVRINTDVWPRPSTFAWKSSTNLSTAPVRSLFRHHNLGGFEFSIAAVDSTENAAEGPNPSAKRRRRLELSFFVPLRISSPSHVQLAPSRHSG